VETRAFTSGPVVVLVRLPQRTMHVYRNGILIGRSRISSGSTGNSTPPDVFNIFDNKETHYSKTYNDAPMLNMQRLTWSGIAMQSGQLRGYPARDGCIRLPYDFSALLFDATSKGRRAALWMPVVVNYCVYGSVRSSRTGWPMKSRRARP
jgi:lipoprotein-anchoring transpeptidase ErfK/SrfK